MKITAWAAKPKDKERLAVGIMAYGPYMIFPSAEACDAYISHGEILRENGDKEQGDLEMVEITIEL